MVEKTYLKSDPTSTQYRISGDPMETLAEVKSMLEQDHARVVQCYDHMKMRVVGVDLSNFPDSIVVDLYKSRYAGD